MARLHRQLSDAKAWSVQCILRHRTRPCRVSEARLLLAGQCMCLCAEMAQLHGSRGLLPELLPEAKNVLERMIADKPNSLLTTTAALTSGTNKASIGRWTFGMHIRHDSLAEQR